MAWDGTEKRKNTNYHDLLIRIDANLENLKNSFDKHEISEKEKFDGIEIAIKGANKRINDLSGKLNFYSGGVAAFSFLINFLFKK